MSRFLVRIVLVLSLWSVLPAARGQQAPSDNPFAPPQAKLQYAPGRDYDLRQLSVDLVLDTAKRSFHGVVVNTLAPLRQGLTSLRFDCGENLNVTACEIGGQKAAFSHNGDRLTIT